MRERRDFASMVCKKEVIAWFSDLTTWRRIDFLCALMDCCGSAELRFLGTYIEALCRRDYDSLREAELSANDVSYLSKLTRASDKRILDKVLTSLALMNSRCTEGARVLFKMLQEHTDAILNGHDEPVLCNRENANCRETDEKVVLLALMAVNHPAFTFSQKQVIRRQLSALLQAVESETAIDVENEEGDVQPNVKTERKNVSDKSEDIDKSQDDKACIEKIVVMDSFQIRPSDKRYECVFKVHWKDGKESTVSKTHAELFEFQCKLVQRFPEVSNKERLIPYVPGETQGKHIFSGAQARDSNEKITSKDFLEYARKLSALPPAILNCDLMIEFFKENTEGQVVPSASPSTGSSNSPSTSLTSKTLHSPPHRNKMNQNGDNQALPETVSSTPSTQEHQQPHVHMASPIPHAVYPLTASLRHLDISHHHNINLAPPSPISVSAHLNPSPHSNTSTPPASSISTSSATATSSGTNSVYFQTISSAVSIPTPAELYNVGDSNSDLVASPRQPFEASLLSKAQASPQVNSVSFAPPLPSTTEPLVSKVNANDGSSVTPNENGDVPPVMATPTVHLPHPMPCFTTSDCQPFSSTALPKSPVASQIQEWLKKQRLHKYEHYFEGLSVEQILALTDEDIDKWDIVTGAKGRIKSQLEQLRQSLMNPANGMTTPTAMEQSHYAMAPPVTFIQPPPGPTVPFQYYLIHPNSMSQGIVAPQFLPSAGQEGLMSSDNSSSGSVSRESSDECDRDSEESEPCGFQSQDVRTHCPVEPNRKHGGHTPRHHQSKLSHTNTKSTGNHTVPVSPVPYSQIVKNPVSPSGEGGKKETHKGSRNNRSANAPPFKRMPPPSDGTPQIGQHPPLIIRGNSNSPVPHIAHSVMMSPKGQGKNESELPSAVPSRQQKSSGSQKVNQSNVARSQIGGVPQMHGTANQGWHPSNNGSQLMVANHGIPGIPGNVVSSHIATGQQIGGIQGVATSIQNLHMEQYGQNSQPRIEVPQHVPMVQVKHHGNRQSGNTNHFVGEDGMGYRTVVMQSGVPVQVNNPTSESLQGHASPGMRSDGGYIGSASGPTPSNPKVIYSNPLNQLPGSCSAPSSHAPSENFSASSTTTTYVQAANQNTVSVVASSLGMMQLAYSNQMVMAGSSGTCSCNPNNGNQSNQSCPLHHFPVTNALLPNPPYLPYQNFQNFFQGGVGSNHLVQSVNVLKGPTAPGNPRYMAAGPGPNTAAIPSEIFYGHHYGVMAQQGQMFFNQMNMGQRGPHSPHTGIIPDGSKKGTLSCFNCGAQGHKASDCRETTMETITQNSQYRLNYKPDTTES